MTDKQIIIDGVDVSECKKYEHEMTRCNTSFKNMCFYGGRCTDKRNADCYYKQFKRKEQECEELKDEIFHLRKEGKKSCAYCADLIAKEQECERLMSTLTEIKEIAEVLITTTDEYDSCYYKDKCSKCEVKEDCQYIKVEQILQKISECEVE